ncbi:MAG: hypothetical protein HQL37_00270 [Alphaproteobacteria bacterium]|nr:hypothetical protein [Alphaproteobacteria bacterium]
MKRLLLSASLGLVLCASNAAFAGSQYNDVPNGDEQYKNCKIYAMKKWEGGGDSSPIPGQSKAEAFCTCMWNETPENFSGGLAKFSESEKGAAMNKTCEDYSNWHG